MEVVNGYSQRKYLNLHTIKSSEIIRGLRVRFETLRRGVQEQRCSLFRDFKVPLFQTFCRSGRLILTGLSGFRNGLLAGQYSRHRRRADN
jgi:hypothetical protein